MEGVALIADRIATIQARFTPPLGPGSVPGGVLGGLPSTAPAAASSSAPSAGTFAAELQRATQTGAAAQGGPRQHATGARVVALATEHLGVPYRWGGTDPATGLDCSGLTQLVYRQVGVDLPRVSWEQARAGSPVESLDHARPGDLVAFNSPVDHIGIYIGDGRMIHAPKPGEVVEISEVYETPTAIRRVLPEAAPGGAAPATPFGALFAAAAGRTGVSADLLAAVARAESAFDPTAVSPAGARGLMQLMPGTARDLGVDPFDPAQAVDGAARLLRAHLQEFGSVPLALAAYNAGPGAVQRHGGIPPYPETRTYVQRVMSALGGAA